MCGIAGFIRFRPTAELELRSQATRMTDQIIHRGPDDSGTWVDAQVGLALGTRRLAIVDLSPAGHQPMVSGSGRFVITYNGEVYNFGELRRELEPKGHTFRGHSDTEVMLTAIEEWGLEEATRKFVGMFAFALWDRQERVLHLVRDRVGIKPLYYGWAKQTFLFGSELKTLRAHAEFVPEIDRGALALQMRYSYVPQPYSIYRGICKLTQGCIVTLSTNGSSASATPPPRPYWSAREIAERGAQDPFHGSEGEAREQLDALLRESVRLRMIADVPLGAFLSGGIDSSTVVALMQAQSARPVKTFTIGFEEDRYNEAGHAKAVAAHLGTEHTELYVTGPETLAVIPKLSELFDEPFSDSSQVPTYLISALARRQVTVSLSGDGGDELFGGYPRYPRANAIWKAIRWLPRSLRRLLSRSIGRRDAAALNARFGWMAPLSNRFGQPGSVGEKLQKLADVMPAQDRRELYRHFVSHWKRPAELVAGAEEPSDDGCAWASVADFWQQMMFFDVLTYLVDDILAKVDRASMGVSLEARVPILDHRVVEFAARLPSRMKIRNGQGKWLLREILYRYVPKELVERPKMGFSVPLDSWLRGPLRDWAEALLSEERLTREGFLRPEPIRKVWAEHLSGQRNWDGALWDVLMFQAWLERWGTDSRLSAGAP